MGLDILSLRDAVTVAKGGEGVLTPEQKLLTKERSELRTEGFRIDSQKGDNEDRGTLTQAQRDRLVEINKRIAEIDFRLKDVKIGTNYEGVVGELKAIIARKS